MLLLLGATLAACGGKEYKASTTLLVGPITADIKAIRATVKYLPAYTQLATSSEVLGYVAASLGLPAGSLQGKVSVTTDDVTRTITISTTGADPDRAAAVANGIAGELLALSASPESSPAPESKLSVVEIAR